MNNRTVQTLHLYNGPIRSFNGNESQSSIRRKTIPNLTVLDVSMGMCVQPIGYALAHLISVSYII